MLEFSRRAATRLLRAMSASAPAAKRQRRAEPRRVDHSCTLDLGQGASVDYHKSALTPEQATRLLEAIIQAAPLAQQPITVMGRRVLQPRLTAYMADDEGLSYTYSGATMVPAPWDATVLEAKERVEELAGRRFDSCLLNLYRGGGDHLGWHSDNERLYGPTPTIGSLTLGAAREFVLRRNADHSDRLVFRLGHGDVLVMRGTLQQHWMHSVPKRVAAPGERLSLTFRAVVAPERPRPPPMGQREEQTGH